MIKSAIENGDIAELKSLLKEQPAQANRGISFGSFNKHKLHPLNFICDRVFENKIDENTALQMVEVFLNEGAAINGNNLTKDTPLIAASSLYCKEIAVFLIDQGADIHHKGTHGGTALHWASWTGSDKIVQRLLKEKVDLEDADNEFKCTPLLWAIHGMKTNHERNHRNQVGVVEHLLQAGADPNAKFQSGKKATEVLHAEKDEKVIALLIQYGVSN